ncbi:MAG: hypothetical protein ACE5H7_15155 [Acidiferrobacterales bacterium]
MLSNWSNAHRMFAIALAFICGVLVSVNSAAFAGGSISIQWGKEGEPVKQKSVKKHSKARPPSHAPAHGHRAKHQYRYYPSHSVYYDSARGLYFYLERDNWQISASLPSKLKVSLGSYVNMELETTKPYVHHREHVKKYPPGKMKKKKSKHKKMRLGITY